MENKLINRDERRRLEKAAREKDKKHLVAWAEQFEDQIRREYEKSFEDELDNSVENFLVAIVYTLHFSELTQFGKKRINEFCGDMMSTVDMFTSKEYTPAEYKEILEKEGIDMFSRKGKK